MLNLKRIFIRLTIAIKVIFIAQLFAFQNVYADGAVTTIQLEIPNASWWNKVAHSQNPNDIHFNSAANLSGLKTLAQVRERMSKAASQSVQIAIQQSETVNAYARQESGYNLIIFTTGFINQFGEDADVLASALGHELAHHTLGHINGKSEIVNLTSNETRTPEQKKAAKAIEIQANELAADNDGIEYAIKAGYSACGGYRLFTYLKNHLPQANDASQSSHPIITERLDLANKLNLKAQKGQCS